MKRKSNDLHPIQTKNDFRAIAKTGKDGTTTTIEWRDKLTSSIRNNRLQRYSAVYPIFCPALGYLG
ncbi:MAG: hypothetical protein HRT35_23700 [Algicola sp.]|nr:hypothetical protein [Algicola sp.]